MCNYIIKNKIANINNLKVFSNLDYKFSDENDKGEILFTRQMHNVNIKNNKILSIII